MNKNKTKSPEEYSHPDVIEKDIRELIHQIAEFESHLSDQKREEHEKTEKLLLELIDVCDAFERVFRTIRENEGDLGQSLQQWISNFSSIHKLVERILKNQGVKEIKIVEPFFDPNWHKIHKVVDNNLMENGMILDEVYKGYVWRGNILREVIVNVVGSS